MKRLKEAWRALLVILLIGLVAGVLNVVLHDLVMEPWIQARAEDEVVVSTYVLNLFVGWIFFSAWFLARADDDCSSRLGMARIADTLYQKQEEHT